jgi:hypothetical protein
MDPATEVTPDVSSHLHLGDGVRLHYELFHPQDISSSKGKVRYHLLQARLQGLQYLGSEVSRCSFTSNPIDQLHQPSITDAMECIGSTDWSVTRLVTR